MHKHRWKAWKWIIKKHVDVYMFHICCLKHVLIFYTCGHFPVYSFIFKIIHASLTLVYYLNLPNEYSILRRFLVFHSYTLINVILKPLIFIVTGNRTSVDVVTILLRTVTPTLTPSSVWWRTTRDAAVVTIGRRIISSGTFF